MFTLLQNKMYFMRINYELCCVNIKNGSYCTLRRLLSFIVCFTFMLVVIFGMTQQLWCALVPLAPSTGRKLHCRKGSKDNSCSAKPNSVTRIRIADNLCTLSDCFPRRSSIFTLDLDLKDCCGAALRLDWAQADMSFLTDYLRLDDPNFLITVVLIMFSPTYWNLVARSEYRTHWVTRLFRSARVGCSVLAVSIMLLGLHRDWWFQQTLHSQPKASALQLPVLGYAVIAIGALLVLSSFWALGWYGTFLGDYFGMLMDEPVTSFPFNLVSDPMYVGTTMNFAGVALLEGSVAGLVLAALVGLCYKVALLFEGPFTEEIYRKRDADKRKV